MISILYSVKGVKYIKIKKAIAIYVGVEFKFYVWMKLIKKYLHLNDFLKILSAQIVFVQNE